MSSFFSRENTTDVSGAKSPSYERFPTLILTALFFLVPLFFLPYLPVPFNHSKVILIFSIVALSLCLWVLARLKDGRVIVPQKNWVFISALIFLVVYTISALFSGSRTGSFIGQGFELDTVSVLALFVLLMFLVSAFFRTREKIFYSYMAFFAAFLILSVFHIIRVIFGPETLTLGIFRGVSANTVGSWNDLGIFFGLAALLAFVTLEFVTLTRPFKVFLYYALISSLFLLAVINFTVIWYALGIVAVAFFIYFISLNNNQTAPEFIETPVADNEDSGTILDSMEMKQSERSISGIALAIIIISFLFVLGGGFINGLLSNVFNISVLEARPSWQATAMLARQTLAEDPLLGVGPNNFSRQWIQYKPDAVNNTIFWNTDFTQGIGLIPSSIITTGILGFLAWLLFLGSFIYLGFKAMFARVSNKLSRFFIVSSFLAALYLWVFSVFYIPSLTTLALTFAFTGLFIASVLREKIVPTVTLSLFRTPRASFVAVLILVALLIADVTWGYYVLRRVASSVYFESSVLAAQRGASLDHVEQGVINALQLANDDAYYRLLANINLARMEQTLLQQGVSPEVLRAQFQNILAQTVQAGQLAVAANPQNYQNHLMLGQVYASVVPLKVVEGAYEAALAAYEEAERRNPKNPAIDLLRARLEVANGNLEGAQQHIVNALQKKSNYTDAIFLLSQIQVEQGNVKAAIQSIETATLITPNNPVVFFQLGLLKYNDRNYEGAASSLERAVVLDSQYANAKYFLGLSYERLGRREDAIKQFEGIKVTNPDNQEIELILSNLKAGKSPFTDARPPIDDQPERRSELPVRDAGGVTSGDTGVTN